MTQLTLRRHAKLLMTIFAVHLRKLRLIYSRRPLTRKLPWKRSMKRMPCRQRTSLRPSLYSLWSRTREQTPRRPLVSNTQVAASSYLVARLLIMEFSITVILLNALMARRLLILVFTRSYRPFTRRLLDLKYLTYVTAPKVVTFRNPLKNRVFRSRPSTQITQARRTTSIMNRCSVSPVRWWELRLVPTRKVRKFVLALLITRSLLTALLTLLIIACLSLTW